MLCSGNNVGEIAGHAKMLITCAFKTTRPFRIITGSEDNAVILHEGPPFKLKTLARVRYLSLNSFFFFLFLIVDVSYFCRCC
jgi:hypothetical protein